MALYRGPGGANDGIPASSSTEFPGDVNVAGNLHVNGDITSDGNIDGVHIGDGSGLTGVITELPTLAELGIENHDLLTVDSLGNVTVASDLTVDGILYGDGSGLTNLSLPDVYTKTEIDTQQGLQDTAIANNATAIQANTDAIDNIVPGIGDAPNDGQQYARESQAWSVVASSGGGASANGVIYENGLTITDNYTLTTNKNGMSVGPITVDTGTSVTIPSGQRWVIL